MARWEKEVRGMITVQDKSEIPYLMSRSKWIKCGPLKAYLRVTSRYHHGINGTAKTIDVASVEVREPDRRKGHFTIFMGRVEKLAKDVGRFVYVENVMDEWLADSLEKRGYKHVHTSGLDMRLYLDPKDIK